MLFCSIRQNLKAKRLTIFKFAMALILFVELSDKSLFQNFINNYTGSTLNFFSMEKFVNDIVSISKLLSTSLSISFGLGEILVGLVFVMVIAFALFLLFRVAFRSDNLENKSTKISNINIVAFATNDIYLQTNKLIC